MAWVLQNRKMYAYKMQSTGFMGYFWPMTQCDSGSQKPHWLDTTRMGNVTRARIEHIK